MIGFEIYDSTVRYIKNATKHLFIQGQIIQFVMKNTKIMP